jgi:hypothetical protein
VRLIDGTGGGGSVKMLEQMGHTYVPANPGWDYVARLDGHPVGALAAIRARLDAVRSPLRTAERFGVEEIIDPRETRPLLCDWIHDAYAALPASPGQPAFGTRP